MSQFTKGLIAVAGMSLCVSGTAFANDLTVVSWGGAYTMSQVEAYHKPWMAKTGKTIVSEDYSGGIAEIKAQVESGNVTWDIVDVELSDALRACDEGLLEEIDHATLPAAPDGTPATEDFLPGTLQDCAVANIFWSSVYVYDAGKTRNWNAPKTMADFFDLEAFPGKRGMRKSPKVTLEFALIGDGVPTDQVYDLLRTEEGVARAFAKLDTIKDQVVWWEAGAQPAQLLADEEVVFTTAWNGRIFDAVAADGQTFEMVWDGQVYDIDLWVIPKGGKNTELALEFLKYTTSTDRLAAQASYIPYGPARQSSIELMGTYFKDDSIKMAPHMPTAPENFTNPLQNDFEFWADNADQLNERFNAWLAS